MHILPVIGIVLPCCNESDVLPETFTRINAIISDLMIRKIISERSFAVFVDDGSKDNTWELIRDKALKLKNMKGLRLAANVGHQKALLAGLTVFRHDADALITMDADLQDDPHVIEQLVLKFSQGAEIVYAARERRETDTFFKRKTAMMFYGIMKRMKVNIIYNHADFRLCGKRALCALSEFEEVNLFLRGIIPSIGFKSDVIYYDRLERFAGKSKYPIGKMVVFAWEGITSFNNYPLRLVTIIGFLVFFVCLILGAYALLSLILGDTVPGWLSTVLPMYFLGGIQLLCLGIIGEYIGKVYLESKRRPRYFIDEMIT